MLPAEFSADLIGQWVGQHLWPLFRLASFLMVIPIFGTQLVPARIRLGLALLMTILIVPMLPPVPQVEALSADAVVITLQQILIGVGMGFALTALWQLFVVAGQMIAMQMGLGFASMVDPANGVNVPVLSQIYTITITLLFLAMNGHLAAFEVFIESFRTMPIGLEGLGQGGGARPPITAAAVACMFNSGEYETDQVKKMMAYCEKNVWPGRGVTSRFGHWHYTHYYYSQVMYRMGDEKWGNYYGEIKKQLLRTQSSSGAWLEGYIGPVYTTSINATILQLENGFLPIYQR